MSTIPGEANHYSKTPHTYGVSMQKIVSAKCDLTSSVIGWGSPGFGKVKAILLWSIRQSFSDQCQWMIQGQPNL
jgi:hypothetical protein